MIITKRSLKKASFSILLSIIFNGDNMSKDTFKSFARVHPELATTVLNGNATWQQLYELFEIYGETGSVWNKYLNPTELVNQTSNITSFKDFFNTFKNLDMDSVQKGVTNLQKTIGLLQEIGLGSKSVNQASQNYEPRPLYKHFED